MNTEVKQKHSEPICLTEGRTENPFHTQSPTTYLISISFS